MANGNANSPDLAQRKSNSNQSLESGLLQKKENNTGLADHLKSGVENLSGISLDDVNVHYNSDQPAQLNAHAFAQGTDIHVAPGQEKHVPHEAWHVVQQKQGRVKPTAQLESKVNINDDAGLEKEADVMGQKALNIGENNSEINSPAVSTGSTAQMSRVTQRNLVDEAADLSSVTEESELSNSYELNPLQDDEGEDKSVPFLGGVIKLKGDPTKGECEFEYEHSLFQMSGSRTANEETGGFDYEGKGGPLPLTQEAKGKVPIAPIPLGIPGLFAEVSITAEASASIVGNAGIRFKQDANKKFIPGSLDFVAASVEANLEAKCGIEEGLPQACLVWLVYLSEGMVSLELNSKGIWKLQIMMIPMILQDIGRWALRLKEKPREKLVCLQQPMHSFGRLIRRSLLQKECLANLKARWKISLYRWQG